MQTGGISERELFDMKQIDICKVDKETLVDVSQMHIDTNKASRDRICDFIERVKNPYCFRVGDIAVKVEFEDTNVTFEQRFENLLANQ